MIGWLYRILIGHFHSCRHEWETKQVVKFEITRDGAPYKTGDRVFMCCKKCGDWTKRDLI